MISHPSDLSQHCVYITYCLVFQYNLYAYLLFYLIRRCSCSVVSDSLGAHGLQPAWLLCPWDSPGKNTRVGCHYPLQGIFPTQGSDPKLLHWQADSLPLAPPGKLIKSSVQSASHVQLCNPMDCCMTGLPVHHQIIRRDYG